VAGCVDSSEGGDYEDTLRYGDELLRASHPSNAKDLSQFWTILLRGVPKNQVRSRFQGMQDRHFPLELGTLLPFWNAFSFYWACNTRSNILSLSSVSTSR